MAKVSGTVSSYAVSVESDGGGKVLRNLRLQLAATRDGDAPFLDVDFVDKPPDDFIVFATGSVTVSLAASAFASMYDILRTERPVFASAEEVQLLGKTRRRFVLSTGAEPTGEGDVDGSAVSPPPFVPLPDPPPFRQP
jgi:hypothetical protein